jgi:hypothetical protein
MQADNRPEMRAPQKAILHKERSAMLKIAPLRKKRYPARGARKKQFPINAQPRFIHKRQLPFRATRSDRQINKLKK